MKKYELKTLNKYPRLFIGRKVFFQLPKNELHGISDLTPNKLYTLTSCWENHPVFTINDDVGFEIFIRLDSDNKNVHLDVRTGWQLHHSKKGE